jgi:hypothetical protein
MTNLVIHWGPASPHDACDFCGGQAVASAGPQLYRADNRQAVCRNCGKKHAPSLVALLDLASTAQRVGRIGRHTIVPPMTSLLDLARAAENYTFAAPHPVPQAA